MRHGLGADRRADVICQEDDHADGGEPEHEQAEVDRLHGSSHDGK